MTKRERRRKTTKPSTEPRSARRRAARARAAADFSCSNLNGTDKACLAVLCVALAVLVFEVLALQGFLPTPCELTKRFEVFTCS
jgi:hypothetical protein